MTWKSKLKGAAIGAFVGAPGQRARAAAAEAARRLRREPRRADVYHDVTDPWSYLVLQAVARLADRFDVAWRLHLVAPPSSDVDAAPGLRADYAVRDARELAARWDVSFEGKRPLDQGSARWMASVLVRERPFPEQLRAALELGDAAWRGDGAALQRVVGAWGHDSIGTVAPALAEGYAHLRAAGHYQGGTIAYGGEWYGGLDRIAHLERRLADDTGVAAEPSVLRPRPDAARPPARLAGVADGPVPVDVWFSFRSPYSYLAIERLDRVAEAAPVELRLRPVLPMVQRGIPAPWTKRRYLVMDAKREADRLGIPFGRIADPLGKGVEHCLAIARLADERGRGLELARSAMRGIWAEARDLADLGDLRAVVERAGLAWDDARAAIAEDAARAWRAWAAANAEDLAAIGLWGVPSFRAGDWYAWGQDRLDFLVDRLRRHVAAPPVAADATEPAVDAATAE